MFSFCGAPLPLYLIQLLINLGHVLRFDLDDNDDIIRALVIWFAKPTTCVLRSFAGCDPIVKTKLIVSGILFVLIWFCFMEYPL